ARQLVSGRIEGSPSEADACQVGHIKMRLLGELRDESGDGVEMQAHAAGVFAPREEDLCLAAPRRCGAACHIDLGGGDRLINLAHSKDLLRRTEADVE